MIARRANKVKVAGNIQKQAEAKWKITKPVSAPGQVQGGLTKKAPELAAKNEMAKKAKDSWNQ